MPKSQHSDANDALCAALVAAREEADVTQAELARRLGKPQQFVSKIETGRRGLALLEFVAIARAMRVDAADLFVKVVKKLPKTIDI